MQGVRGSNPLTSTKWTAREFPARSWYWESDMSLASRILSSTLSRVALASLTALTLTGVVGTAAFADAPIPPPSPADLNAQIKLATTKATTATLGPQILTAAKSSYELGPCVQDISSPGNRFTQCDFGSVSAAKTVVLLGDSQASMWLPAFDAAGKAHGFHVILLARLGCNSNPLVTLSFTGAVDPQCAVFRTASLNLIKTLHSPIVMFAQIHRFPLFAKQKPVPNTTWTSSMVSLFSSLKGAGAKSIAFLEPAPVDPVDAATCLSQHLSSSQKCTFSASVGFVNDARTADEKAATSSRVPIINTLSLFCTSSVTAPTTKCPAQVNGQLVYADRWHTSAQYAAYSWRALAALAKL